MIDRPFVSGRELNHRFFEQAVRPVMERAFPSLVYSAGLLGYGSDVLGFDTARSMDHNWGPRCLLFLGEMDYPSRADAVSEVLSHELPLTFEGFPTNFADTGEAGIGVLHPAESQPIKHRVEVTSIPRFVEDRLGWRLHYGVNAVDWLLASDERLLEITAGALFHDGLGDLGAIQEMVAYYPDQIWRYILAAQWQRISQKEAFVGRTGEVGDELGSAVVAGMLVRDLMRLAFILERVYAPYEKWLGSAFTKLKGAAGLGPSLAETLAARNWREREIHLGAAYSYLAELHNAFGITEPVSPELRPYHRRPYRVLHAERFTEAIQATITDVNVQALPPGIGSIDQFVDSTDLLTHPERRSRLAAVYTAGNAR